MKKAMVLLAVASLIGAIHGIASAQQDKTGANPQTTEVTVYYAVVIGDGTIEGSAKVISIGPERRTKAEADADEKRWNNDHPKSLRLTDVREKTIKTPAGKFMDAKEAVDKVKDAKEAVDKAKESMKEGLTAEEQKLGDTLKEYANRIKDVYKQAVDAKKNLTSMTGTIARKQFQDVNNAIDRFNQTRTYFGRQVQSAIGNPAFVSYNTVLSRFPMIPRLSPQDLKGRLEPDTSSSKFTVWVFRQEGGQWAKKEDRTFGTNDEDQARKYMDDVKAIRGWTATSNLPQRTNAVGEPRNAANEFLGVWENVVTHGPSKYRSILHIKQDGTLVQEILTYYNGSVSVAKIYGSWQVDRSSISMNNDRTEGDVEITKPVIIQTIPEFRNIWTKSENE